MLFGTLISALRVERRSSTKRSQWEEFFWSTLSSFTAVTKSLSFSQAPEEHLVLHVKLSFVFMVSTTKTVYRFVWRSFEKSEKTFQVTSRKQSWGIFKPIHKSKEVPECGISLLIHLCLKAAVIRCTF